MTDYHFGVEIEMVVAPHKVRQPLSQLHVLYYSKLAAACRNRGLRAKHDDLEDGYRSRSEHFDKWWITRDGSLGQHPAHVPLEAVSPVLRVRGEWEREIATFWAASRAVFHMPERSNLCGSHIHVSLGRGHRFSLSQLRAIAYGIVLYEPLVVAMLMAGRQQNRYCRPNTKNSPRLAAHCPAGGRVDHAAIKAMIKGAASSAAVRDVMQADRYVLWNFANAVPGKSGTVEFRGGRFLRGEVRTKRWIAFTVALLDAILAMDDISKAQGTQLPAWTAEALYDEVKRSARRLHMMESLPDSYKVLNETHREA